MRIGAVINPFYISETIVIKGTPDGSNLRALECQYLEKRGQKIQDYIISYNSNITLFVFISSTIVLSTTDYSRRMHYGFIT